MEEVLYFHELCIERYGGASGVRNEESLRAALERPYGSAFGAEHFPTVHDKAAALCESIIRRHPFVDGNKRTALISSAYVLHLGGYELTAPSHEAEEFIVAVAEGGYDTSEISGWFVENSSSRTS